MSQATNHHASLVEDAKAAIQEVHGDTNVSQQQTIASLREIAEEIEVMISSVEDDMRRADYDPRAAEPEDVEE